MRRTGRHQRLVSSDSDSIEVTDDETDNDSESHSDHILHATGTTDADAPVLADTHDDQASENPAQRTKTVASDLLQQVGGMFDTETDASIAAMVDDCADNISGSSSDDDEAPMSNFIVRVNPYIYQRNRRFLQFGVTPLELKGSSANTACRGCPDMVARPGYGQKSPQPTPRVSQGRHNRS
eukprot:COSAG01_NODE_2100_length_8429_cov_29.066507_7_plen_181_part_00